MSDVAHFELSSFCSLLSYRFRGQNVAISTVFEDEMMAFCRHNRVKASLLCMSVRVFLYHLFPWLLKEEALAHVAGAGVADELGRECEIGEEGT